MEEIFQRLKKKHIAVFLDYDGTLTHIVARPGEANLSDSMRNTLRHLADHCSLAVISGRDLRDVRARAGIDTIFYAGSHGFEIAGPGGRIEQEVATDYLPALDNAEQTLREKLSGIDGAHIERKKFSVAVHYRMVKKDGLAAVERAVDQVLLDNSSLRKSHGKKIFELQPDIDWHKGKALLWLLDVLNLDRSDTLPIYIGDDVTDEDAFNSIRGRGIGIAVRGGPQCTAASYTLQDPDEVQTFLQSLIDILKKDPAQ
jgi:trehalose-phosphatase